jgi:hypothetical protein
VGYFSNSSDGEAYYSHFCARCLHNPTDPNAPYCPIWDLHMMRNYEECNKADSPLHVLIPRDKKTGSNLECKMFWLAPSMGLPLEGGG